MASHTDAVPSADPSTRRVVAVGGAPVLSDLEPHAVSHTRVARVDANTEMGFTAARSATTAGGSLPREPNPTSVLRSNPSGMRERCGLPALESCIDCETRGPACAESRAVFYQSR